MRKFWTKALGWSAAALVVAGLGSPAWAEGSRSLYPTGYEATDGGNNGRANLDLTDSNTRYLGVAARRTFLYVYARQNEHILLGSRNRTAAGTGAIRIYAPQSFGTPGTETIPGSSAFTCTAGTTGLIASRAEELAGPRAVSGGGNPTGFAACTYQAPADGIYGVLFSTGGGGAPDGSVATPAESNATVSAWDVTVRSSDPTSVANLDGRVFTYAWSAFTGGNGATRRLYSDLFYATSDGYRYRQRLTGLDLNGGTFFANARGFVDSGEPLYKDIRGTNQLVATGIPAGVSADPPQYPIFFTSIAPGATEAERTLQVLGIPLTPKPPQVNSFSFIYPPINSSTSYVGQGGVFRFYVTDTFSYQIVISRDGVDWDPATTTNRVLTGTSGTGEYSVVWDGKDNAGTNFPAGSNYQFRISGRNGEVHFPFVDAEANVYGGPIVTKLNGNVVDSLIYYDDRGYVTRGGTAVGTLNGHLCGNNTYDNTTPNQALLGVDSSALAYDNGGGANTAYARGWRQSNNNNTDCAGTSQGFGDAKGLNSWTFQTTVPQSNVLHIVDAADVKASVSAPVSTSAGATVNLTVGFANVGSQTAAATTYAVQLPTGLAGVVCSGATCSYNAGTGGVTITGLPGSLSAGQGVNFSLSYTAPASGNVPVQASVGTSTSQGANLAPDTAGATTLVGGSSDADVLTTVSPPPTAVQGGAVAVPVQYANVGATSAPITSYGLQLPAGLTGVSCGGGITCAYNAGTGAVVLSGTPATLAAGQSLGFTLNYVAPAAGSTVVVNSSIATSASEVNTANNTAQGATTTASTAGVPDVLASLAAPATASPGSTVEVPVRFSNAGNLAAAGVTYALTLPTGLAGVTCAAPVACSYTSGTGAVTVSGLAGTLAPGDWANLTLRYTSPIQGVVPVTASVATTTPGETNTANNTASGHTTIVTGAAGADVTVTVSPPASAAPGATVGVPVNVSNLGPQDAQGVAYTLTLPAGLSGVLCSGGATCSYNSGTGAVTVTGLPATLTAGQAVPFTLQYTAPGTGQVAVQAAVSTTSFDSNTGNNTALGTTTIASGGGSLPDVTTSVAPPSTALAGAAVQVPVSFSNVGASAAASVTYTVQLTGSPGAVSVAYNGTPCAYNAGTGAITGCGLPATLTPGQSLGLVLTYTAPASGTVGVASTVATATAESNSANNTAQATTTILGNDMAVSLAGLPTTGTVGLPYSGFFTCTNTSANAASGVACGVSGLPAGVAVGACTVTPANAAWSAGSAVAAGQTVRCAVAGAPTAVGTSTVAGTTGATGDTNIANNTASQALAIGATPPPQAIPTLGQWALLLLSALLALAGAGAVRGRSYS